MSKILYTKTDEAPALATYTDPQIINEVLQAYDNAQPDAVYVSDIGDVSVVPAEFDVHEFSAAALRNTSPLTQ